MKTRAALKARAVLIIMDSLNPDLSNIRIAGAIEGALEIEQSLASYYETLTKSSYRKLVNEIRDAVTAHPRYVQLINRTSGAPRPELVRASQAVKDILE